MKAWAVFHCDGDVCTHFGYYSSRERALAREAAIKLRIKERYWSEITVEEIEIDVDLEEP